jgi:hypothetical protein
MRLCHFPERFTLHLRLPLRCQQFRRCCCTFQSVAVTESFYLRVSSGFVSIQICPFGSRNFPDLSSTTVRFWLENYPANYTCNFNLGVKISEIGLNPLVVIKHQVQNSDY